MATPETSKDAAPEPVTFETAPARYRHMQLEIDGPVATIKLNVQENEGLKPGYVLKLNSYDMGVDVELADAVQRIRFEHPEVTCVVVTSALDGVFSSGANIFMLGTSTHAFKVNFCRFTNETRLAIEDATEHSGQTYVAALNGIASGGGYELPLACKEIYLVDDRRSAVALPEVPYLGVLPGTGGLTRVVDKRKVRRDRADVFTTLAEGIKGKRAVEWGLVDAVYPPSKFAESVKARVAEIAGAGRTDRKGVALEPLEPEIADDRITYRHVTLSFGPTPRTARIELRVPADLPEVPANAADLGSAWFPLRALRELDDALLRLRFNHPDVGLVILATRSLVGEQDFAVFFDDARYQTTPRHGSLVDYPERTLSIAYQSYLKANPDPIRRAQEAQDAVQQATLGKAESQAIAELKKRITDLERANVELAAKVPKTTGQLDPSPMPTQEPAFQPNSQSQSQDQIQEFMKRLEKRVAELEQALKESQPSRK